MSLHHSRRRFLRNTTIGSIAALMPDFAWAAERYPMSIKPNPSFRPDVEIEFTSRVMEVAILRGPHTSVFRYEGKVLKGPADALKMMPSYFGPTMNLARGQKVRIFFYNKLPEPSVMHWHGMHVPQQMDGHPMYEIQPGERYVYEFEVRNPAGTNWYHSHTHELTATQVYRGQAGLITVTDDEEQKLDLPGGEYDIPIAIQDRRFTEGNQLEYIFGMHERMVGFLGETILVNGQPNAVIPVKTRAYRLRIFNGSNSRIYKLGWSDGMPMIAIGTDGSLLEKPETHPYIMLSPAERVEVWADFSGRKPGAELVLHSLEFEPTLPGMGMGGRRGMGGTGHRGMGMGGMGGMDGGMGGRGGMGPMGRGRGSTLAQGEAFPIATFRIQEKTDESHKLPATLAKLRKLTEQDAANRARPVPIAASMGHMTPQLNGMTFEMLDYVESERIPLNTIQKIRITNDQPSHMGGEGGMGGMGGGMRGGMGGMGGMGMMMAMAHPIHIHGQQFRVLSRSFRDKGDTPSRTFYDSVREGFVDSGMKDTVLLMPGEEIDIIKPFEHYGGLFLYHCHTLEHEDSGMMRNFFVG